MKVRRRSEAPGIQAGRVRHLVHWQAALVEIGVVGSGQNEACVVRRETWSRKPPLHSQAAGEEGSGDGVAPR